MKIVVEDKRLTPTYANPGDAGADLRASLAKPVFLQPGEIVAIPTGVLLQMPSGIVGLICPRSGLALKHGLTVVNAPGVIDSGFTGEIKVILQVLGDHALEIKPFDRIAQIVFTVFVPAVFEHVESLDETARGEGGFGSTGTV